MVQLVGTDAQVGAEGSYLEPRDRQQSEGADDRFHEPQVSVSHVGQKKGNIRVQTLIQHREKALFEITLCIEGPRSHCAIFSECREQFGGARRCIDASRSASHCKSNISQICGRIFLC